jgi:hypothetical protein
LSAGKQGQLNLQRDAYNAAANTRRLAVEAAETFNGNAIDLLKGRLGRNWNPAGRRRVSLAAPASAARSAAALLEFRGYFVLHPAHENVATQITAVRADTLATAISDAVHDENAARTARNTAANLRDAAFEQLRSRLVGVRRELEELLEDDDERWVTFGFTRRSIVAFPRRSRVLPCARRLGRRDHRRVGSRRSARRTTASSARCSRLIRNRSKSACSLIRFVGISGLPVASRCSSP